MTIDWDVALAPARPGPNPTQGKASSPSAPAVKPPPFRTCLSCRRGFQRWPVKADGEWSQSTLCPGCRVVESGAAPGVGPAGGPAVGIETQDMPIPY